MALEAPRNSPLKKRNLPEAETSSCLLAFSS
jgi:hypothetical protein